MTIQQSQWSSRWVRACLFVVGTAASACAARSSLPTADESAGDQGGGSSTGTTVGGDCAGRIGQVSCRAEPPDCGPNEFPASDGVCWTGECLDCIDGCQRNDECVVVEACGCSYHEGCSWAETVFRAELLDPCIRAGAEICTTTCPSSVCSALDCPWCNADGAECRAGRCGAIVSHECY